MAARYRRRIFPVAAVERLDGEGFRSVGELVGPGGIAGFFRRDTSPVVVPPGWAELHVEPVTQYVSDRLAEPPDLGYVELGEDDVDEMVALTKLTEPGPFSTETYRTGRYIGLRRNGKLIAMAGERMRVEGWGEVSAVCVHPDGQRQGLGEAVTLAAAEAIIGRGDRAMLHVRSGNDPAHRLYQRLGFAERAIVTVSVYRRDQQE
jgi:predicted GNAT family acetyltransferase